jgi:hypothetical protein
MPGEPLIIRLPRSEVKGVTWRRLASMSPLSLLPGPLGETGNHQTAPPPRPSQPDIFAEFERPRQDPSSPLTQQRCGNHTRQRRSRTRLASRKTAETHPTSRRRSTKAVLLGEHDSAHGLPVRPRGHGEIGAGFRIEEMHVVLFEKKGPDLTDLRIVSGAHPGDNPMRAARGIE